MATGYIYNIIIMICTLDSRSQATRRVVFCVCPRVDQLWEVTRPKASRGDLSAAGGRRVWAGGSGQLQVISRVRVLRPLKGIYMRLVREPYEAFDCVLTCQICINHSVQPLLSHSDSR